MIEPKKPQVSLWEMLERRYESSQGWLLFYEVANGTGFKGTGYADALVMSVWPSRGIQLLGFEIKKSRSDLVSELRDERKAEHFLKYCHAWYLVVSDAKLVDGVEIPAKWGILAPRNGVLYQIRAAPKLEPDAWKLEFIAAFMRRFHETSTKKDMEAVKKMVEERATVMAAENAKRTQKTDDSMRWKQEVATLRKAIDDFEAKSGIPINQWTAGDVGEIVRQILETRATPGLRLNLKQAMDSAERIAKSMKGALANLERIGAALSE